MYKLSNTEKGQYKARADFRNLIRKFFAFTEDAAQNAGITGRQHEALIAIMAADRDPTIGDLAECLVIRHHSAVGLVDRLEAGGFVFRRAGSENYKEVVICLRPKAIKLLDKLAGSHKQELKRIGPLLAEAFKKLG